MTHKENCCCNCGNQLKLMKHPSNKYIGKGQISEPLGFVCNVTFDCSTIGQAYFMEQEHGICELYTEKLIELLKTK